MTMIFATLFFALLGLLSDANRGSLITAVIMLFVFMGSFAGYESSKQYKMFRGLEWRQNTLLVALLYPGVTFSILFILNCVLLVEGSSGNISNCCDHNQNTIINHRITIRCHTISSIFHVIIFMVLCICSTGLYRQLLWI